MRRVNKSALVLYRADEMFDLVDDIDAYADFLPWCNDSRVIRRQANTVEASIEVHRGPVSKTFTTLNTNVQYQSIDIALLGGPFRHLSGGWRFDALGESGCKVALELEFAFESRMVDAMFGAFFEETCNSLVDAFIMRATSVYGDR